VLTATAAHRMELETKFLRLRTPVTIGSLFGEWQVTWLGGWIRDRLSYLVMVARVRAEPRARSAALRSYAHLRLLAQHDVEPARARGLDAARRSGSLAFERRLSDGTAAATSTERF
jgi:hypothetical protein